MVHTTCDTLHLQTPSHPARELMPDYISRMSRSHDMKKNCIFIKGKQFVKKSWLAGRLLDSELLAKHLNGAIRAFLYYLIN